MAMWAIRSRYIAMKHDWRALDECHMPYKTIAGLAVYSWLFSANILAWWQMWSSIKL